MKFTIKFLTLFLFLSLRFVWINLRIFLAFRESERTGGSERRFETPFIFVFTPGGTHETYECFVVITCQSWNGSVIKYIHVGFAGNCQRSRATCQICLRQSPKYLPPALVTLSSLCDSAARTHNTDDIFWQIMTPTRAKNGTKTRVYKLLNLPKLTLVDWIINIRYCYWHAVDTVAIIQTTIRYVDNSVTVYIKIEIFLSFFSRHTVIRKNSVCVCACVSVPVCERWNISISMKRIMYSRTNVAASINLRLQWKFEFSQQIGNWFPPRQANAVTPVRLKLQAIRNETSHSELNYSCRAKLCYSIYLANSSSLCRFTKNFEHISQSKYG